MNFKNHSPEALLSELKSAVLTERQSTTRVLHLLCEVEARRIFGCHGSLFDFTVHELGYSPDAAYRRINAMRVIRDVPEVEAKLESGSLSLSVVAEATRFFRAGAGSRARAGEGLTES